MTNPEPVILTGDCLESGVCELTKLTDPANWRAITPLNKVPELIGGHDDE